MKAGKLSRFEFEIEAAFVSANTACSLKQQVSGATAPSRAPA